MKENSYQEVSIFKKSKFKNLRQRLLSLSSPLFKHYLGELHSGVDSAVARTAAKSHTCHGGQSPQLVAPPPVTQQGSHHANSLLGKPGTNCFYSRPPCTANLSAPWGSRSSSNVQIFYVRSHLPPSTILFFLLACPWLILSQETQLMPSYWVCFGVLIPLPGTSGVSVFSYNAPLSLR